MRQFLRDETGAVTAEYLVLLAVLVGGTLASVSLLALRMSGVWGSWGAFLAGLASSH